VKLIRELRAENARLRALLDDATVCTKLFIIQDISSLPSQYPIVSFATQIHRAWEKPKCYDG